MRPPRLPTSVRYYRLFRAIFRFPLRARNGENVSLTCSFFPLWTEPLLELGSKAQLCIQGVHDSYLSLTVSPWLTVVIWSQFLGPIINSSELETSFITIFFLEMEQTTDEFLESIGSFGRYQILLNAFCNLTYIFWFGIPVMVMVFIASDPGWICKNNVTCPLTKTETRRW